MVNDFDNKVHLKLTCCLFILIKHAERSVTELSTRVCFSVEARDLIELVSEELTDEISRSLRQNEEVILQLHELCYLLVLIKIRGLQRLLKSHRQESNVLYDLLALFNDGFSLLERHRRLSLIEV